MRLVEPRTYLRVRYDALFPSNPTTPVERLFQVVHSFEATLEFMVAPGEGLTAAHVLAEFGSENRIDSVIAAIAHRVLNECRGVEVNFKRKKDERTALWMAVEAENYDLVSKLLEFKADPNVPDRNGVSALALLRTKESLIDVNPERRGWQEKQDVIAQLVSLFDQWRSSSGEQEGAHRPLKSAP